jgi:hypothetical protein
MSVRSNSLVRLVELDVAVAVGAVAVAAGVTNEVAAVVDIAGRSGYPFDTQ